MNRTISRGAGRGRLRATQGLCLFLLLSQPAFGWSAREHMQFARIAALRLEDRQDLAPAFRQWLKRAAPDAVSMEAEHASLQRPAESFVRGRLSYWAVQPDVIAAADKSEVAGYGVPERLLHFTDLEYFNPDPAHRHYSDDLSGLPALKDIPRDRSDPRYRAAGFLPFRVEECYQRSIELIGQDTRGLGGAEDLVKWMGMLSHYAADATQPHHATEDYKSRSYLPPEPRKLADAHADLEYRLFESPGPQYPALREEYWKLYVAALDQFHPGVRDSDPWEGTVETMRKSYANLPLIGHAAAAAYRLGADGKAQFDPVRFFHFRYEVGGREMTLLEMKAQQAAWATLRTEALWKQAWDLGTKVAATQPATRP